MARPCAAGIHATIRFVVRRPLSSDLNLEPISSPNGSLIDLVEDAAEEIFDTVPGTSRADLHTDAMRTAEMDKHQLNQLLSKTVPATKPQTVAMRPPREDPLTEPSVPVAIADIESERLIEHVEPKRSSPFMMMFLVFALIGAATTAWWFLR